MIFEWSPVHVNVYRKYKVIGAYVANKEKHKEEGEICRVIAVSAETNDAKPFEKVFVIFEESRASLTGISRSLFQKRFDSVSPGETFKYRKTWRRLDPEDYREVLGDKKFKEPWQKGMPLCFKTS